jgi:hypothetical protein
MTKRKHFDHGFERTRNGPDGASVTDYGSAIRIGVAKLFLGIVLTLTNKMIYVAREFD